MQLTRHAETRMRQRGVRLEALRVFLDHADVEVPAGGGTTLLRVSRGAELPESAADSLRRYAVLVASDGVIVTVMPVRRRNVGGGTAGWKGGGEHGEGSGRPDASGAVTAGARHGAAGAAA